MILPRFIDLLFLLFLGLASDSTLEMVPEGEAEEMEQVLEQVLPAPPPAAADPRQ